MLVLILLCLLVYYLHNVLQSKAQRVFSPKEKVSQIERRPFIAAIIDHMTRDNASAVLGFRLTRHEWRNGRRHSKYPGKFKPVQVKTYRRCRLPQQKVDDFFQFLEDGDFLQRHAFGKASHILNSGEDVEIDKVSTTLSKSALLRKYAGYIEEVAKAEIDIPTDTDRCRKRYPKSRVGCRLVKDHDGQCVFTSKSCVSPSTILSCLDISTSGPIKHLAGLDSNSIDTDYGTMNYKEMQSINADLAKPLQKTISDSKTISEAICKSIIFHKSKFRSHLQCEGRHICQCLRCGFTYSDQDKTNGHHSGFSENKDLDLDGKNQRSLSPAE